LIKTETKKPKTLSSREGQGQGGQGCGRAYTEAGARQGCGRAGQEQGQSRKNERKKTQMSGKTSKETQAGQEKKARRHRAVLEKDASMAGTWQG
jgi:hypothetical protein